MIASLDGLSDDGQLALEISCGRKTYSKSDSSGKPNKYVIPQLQHVLAVTGLGSVNFWCYRPGREPVHLTIERDNSYIARLIAEEEKFWRKVSSGRTNVLARRSGTQKQHEDETIKPLPSEFLSHKPALMVSKRNPPGGNEDDFMRPKVYVLELEGGYFYVGKCRNFPERVKRHIEGNGSLWTKLHRPIASVEFFWGEEEIERSVTLHYIKNHGIHKVRGWVFSKGGEYVEEHVMHLIGQASPVIPYENLAKCTSLYPMRLPYSSEWEENSKDLDAGVITIDERFY